jgi:hypothetical protein
VDRVWRLVEPMALLAICLRLANRNANNYNRYDQNAAKRRRIEFTIDWSAVFSVLAYSLTLGGVPEKV